MPEFGVSLSPVGNDTTKDQNQGDEQRNAPFDSIQIGCFGILSPGRKKTHKSECAPEKKTETKTCGRGARSQRWTLLGATSDLVVIGMRCRAETRPFRPVPASPDFLPRRGGKGSWGCEGLARAGSNHEERHVESLDQPSGQMFASPCRESMTPVTREDDKVNAKPMGQRRQNARRIARLNNGTHAHGICVCLTGATLEISRA